MKVRRQMKIMELIANRSIQTQEELANLLSQSGFDVTQATVSRDVKELRLIKAPLGENKYGYALPPDLPRGGIDPRLKRIFRESVINMDYSENLIVIKTLPGSAQGVAYAIDNMDWEEILGSLAGDDTILVIVKYKNRVAEVMERFEEFLN
ncbi:MAG TPA: arginine repressor [bacterium]|jgi:transcriptional regulator of arginine metabolism|nr:arginine repressor [bacterium]